MKFTKYLKNLFKSLGAFVALGAVACGFIFAVALLLRCIIRAWHAGWTMFALALMLGSSGMFAAAPPGTPVYFPQVGVTGAANSRDILVIPDPSRVPVVYASNLVAFQTQVLHPVRGGTTNYLLPWGYTVRLDGASAGAHITVPVSTNVINVVSLFTNAVSLGYPLTFQTIGGTFDYLLLTNRPATVTNNGPATILNLTVNGTEGGAGLLVNAPLNINPGIGVFLDADQNVGAQGSVLTVSGGTSLFPYYRWKQPAVSTNGQFRLGNVYGGFQSGNYQIGSIATGFVPLNFDGATMTISADLAASTNVNVSTATGTLPLAALPAVVVKNLPVVTVSASGFVETGKTNNNLMFGPDTPGTLTCGIQEAINSLPKATNRYSPGGGKLMLSPGVFKTAATITVNSNIASSAFTLTIEGVGMTASGILITNQVPASVFTMDALGTTNGWIFNCRDLFFASVTNACTNLLSFNGPIQTGQPYRGNISRCDIQKCWFGWWGKMTNATPSIYGLTPDVANSNGKQNLTAIFYNNNLGDFLTIEKNQFTFIGNIVLANDHLSLWQNSFEGCGTEPGSGVNDWPVTDARRSGYTVIFQEPVGGVTYNNGTTWHVGQNFFVSNAGSYLFNVGFTTKPKMIWSDQFETAGNIVATVCPITLAGWTASVNPMLFYDITNTANFSYAFQSDTGLVSVAELTTGLDKYKFNATNTANVFAGTFDGLLPTNKSPFSVPVTSTVAAITNGNARGTWELLIRFDDGTDTAYTEAKANIKRQGISTNYVSQITAADQGKNAISSQVWFSFVVQPNSTNYVEQIVNGSSAITVLSSKIYH